MTLKNRTIAVAATLFAAAGLSACAQDATADDPQVVQKEFTAGSTMAKLAEAGTITVGTKFDQPGYGLKGLDGKPQGFDVEIAKIIAAKLGIGADKVKFVETPSAVREESIITGKVDVVTATYVITDERRKRVTMAGPYYMAGSDLMVLADNTEITGAESFSDRNLKVCGGIGSIDGEAIREYLADPASQLVEFDVLSKCADALRTGQVDAMTAGNSILNGMTKESNGEFKVVGKPFFEQPYGLGMNKGDVEFCEFVNETLREAAEDGSYEKAWKSTAGEGLEEVPTLPDADPCK